MYVGARAKTSKDVETTPTQFRLCTDAKSRKQLLGRLVEQFRQTKNKIFWSCRYLKIS